MHDLRAARIPVGLYTIHTLVAAISGLASHNQPVRHVAIARVPA